MTFPAYTLRPGEALLVVDDPPSAILVKANADSTDGALIALESTHAGGQASPLHVHHDAAEFFYIIEGDASFYLNGQWFEAQPGAFVAVPRGARHGFRVRSPQTRWLVIFSPAAPSKEEFGPLPEP